MKMLRLIGLAAAVLVLLVFTVRIATGPRNELSQSRIAEIEAQLDAKPKGLGPVCADRRWWGIASVRERTAALRGTAEMLLHRPFPAWSDDAYLDYSRTGVRLNGERMMDARKAWLYPLVIAECVEYKGRFLPAIEKTLSELTRQPTWTYPAHDGKLRNLRRHDYVVELMSADTAHEIAQTLYMLNDKISQHARSAAIGAMEKRVFEPLRRSLAGNKDNTWLRAKNNWNAVCLKGAVGAALTILADRHDRALFAAAAEYYSANYVSGYTADGYTAEGPRYWNYGFSHFAQLREMLMLASHDRIDLFRSPKARTMALYGYRIEMNPGNVAAFGDTPPTTRMDELTRAYANEASQFGFPQRLSALPVPEAQTGNDGPIFRAVLLLFARPAAAAAITANKPEKGLLHDYFDAAGVLVSRPGAGEMLAVSVKAGGNGAHSHNDIGSYTIALGQEQPAGDVGNTVYSAKTFGKQRYTIPAISSWGHPVPVVDGALQAMADKVSPRVIATQLSDERDEITIDLAYAYAQPIIKSLTRTLGHVRGHGGQITITDRFEYAKLGNFEVALTTLGHWQRNADGSIDLWQANEHLHAKIEASQPWDLKAETSTAEGLTFIRLSIRLKSPATKGAVRVVYTPAIAH